MRRTSRKGHAKAAVEELVRRDVLRMQPFTPDNRWRRAPRLGLTQGAGSWPSGGLLLLVARTVHSTPTELAKVPVDFSSPR